MARLPALPSLEIIRGFKGILDFYMWKGLPCVRRWPRYNPANRTAGSRAASVVFSLVIRSFSQLAAPLLEAFQTDSLDQPRTARDIYVTAAYGKLHEANMSDFLTLLQESRDFLEDLTALLDALHSIDTDEIVARVEHSVLPDGAATAAHQVTQNADLAAIATLVDALESADTDALQIRGRDQLFSYKSHLRDFKIDWNADAGSNTLTGSTVPEGEVWIITSLSVLDKDNNATKGYVNVPTLSAWAFVTGWATLTKLIPHTWSGLLILNWGHRLDAQFEGVTLNDAITFTAFGYKMTLET